MIYCRSALFMFIVVVGTIVYGIITFPILLLPKKYAVLSEKLWVKTVFWLMRTLLHLHVDIKGLHNLPKEPCLVASKHQSAWDTVFFMLLLGDPIMVLKRELTWIPFFGWYLIKLGMIQLTRSKGSKDIKNLLRQAKHVMSQGSFVVIFPEGTRTLPGERAPYKRGIGTLYEHLHVSVVPVALNSGVYWGRRDFRKFPGTIKVEILPPIAPGMTREMFMKTLENTMESACATMEVAAPN
jgi:1-acyl-sn-glycerol-3-phosphate acyltransferase